MLSSATSTRPQILAEALVGSERTAGVTRLRVRAALVGAVSMTRSTQARSSRPRTRLGEVAGEPEVREAAGAAVPVERGQEHQRHRFQRPGRS